MITNHQISIAPLNNCAHGEYTQKIGASKYHPPCALPFRCGSKYFWASHISQGSKLTRTVDRPKIGPDFNIYSPKCCPKMVIHVHVLHLKCFFMVAFSPSQLHPNDGFPMFPLSRSKFLQSLGRWDGEFRALFCQHQEIFLISHCG